MPRDKTGHFYYSWYPTIYLADTSRLSLAADCAYRRLIDQYMTTRAPLPDDDAALARLVGVGIDEWMPLSASVRSFFKPSENPAGLLRHAFCDEVLGADTARIRNAKTNGKKGGRPKKAKQKENNPSGFEKLEAEKPKQNNTNSDSKESAPVDFKTTIFNDGLRYLRGATKRTEPTLRALLAKWCRDYGDGAVAAALVKSQQFAPIEPVSFIEKTIKEASHAKPSSANASGNKADRAKAAVMRAAEAGGYAPPGREGQAGGGDDSAAMLPGFETVR